VTADTVFPTVVYRRYTQQWRRVLPNVSGGSSNQDLIPGPLIHARVGDHILVHFKNLDMLYSRPHSMHFHGVHYAPSSDGAYLPGFSGAAPPSSPATRSPTEPRERASWFHSIVRSRLAWP
jgi:manganese oxidase